jgi:hypothetical protein
MFGILSIVMSLVFYPLLDVFSDLHGDWSTIYSSETMTHAIGIGIVHGAILLGMIGAWQVPAVRLRYARITGLQPEEIRKVNRKQVEQELLEAANMAMSSFEGLTRVEPLTSSDRDVTGIRISWTSGGYTRVVVVMGQVQRRLRIEIFGGLRALDGSELGVEQRIKGIRGIPEPARVAPYIVRALRQVEGWSMQPADSSPPDQA